MTETGRASVRSAQGAVALRHTQPPAGVNSFTRQMHTKTCGLHSTGRGRRLHPRLESADRRRRGFAPVPTWRSLTSRPDPVWWSAPTLVR